MISFKDKVKIKRKNIQFHFPNGLGLGFKNHHYIMSGENGVGKTTFLEDVLINRLIKEKQGFVLIGHDFKLQTITLRSFLAVEKTKFVLKSNTSDLIKNWLTRYESDLILIIDEYDTICDKIDIDEIFSQGNFSSSIFVSHRLSLIESRDRFNIRLLSEHSKNTKISSVQIL